MAAGVDAIVGPASSLIAPQVLPITIAGDVLTCSPTASALSLDAYPDQGLFLRTIPSDSLQAIAIARAIERTGKPTAAIAFVDDAFGRPFAELVSTELDRRGIGVLTMEAFDPAGTAYDDEATTVLDTGANVVAVIGDSSAGPRMVEALFDKSEEEAEIIINNAMRVPATASIYARLADADRALLSGVSPQSRIANEALRERFTQAYPESRGLFATYAYDCVNLIALAANSSQSTRAHDDGPARAVGGRRRHAVHDVHRVRRGSASRPQHQLRGTVGAAADGHQRRPDARRVRHVRLRRNGTRQRRVERTSSPPEPRALSCSVRWRAPVRRPA